MQYATTTSYTTAVGTGLSVAGSPVESWRYSYDVRGNRSFEVSGGAGIISNSNLRNQLTQRGGSGKVAVRGVLSGPAQVSITNAPAGQSASPAVQAEITALPGSSQVRLTR
jgi:hypothetical protein